jgi:NADPH:quinone reductase
MTIPNQMQGVRIIEPGGPEVLQLTTVETPRIGAEEVLVKVHAAGVNRPDCLQRAGLYAVPSDASALPGLEISGEIVARGVAVSRWSVGDRVVALTHGGGYAQYCRVHASHCLPWPAGTSAAEAASFPETTFTVQYNLFTRAGLTANDTCLIHGGSSGIGTTAIQLAKAAGARVFTTVGSEEKLDYCRALGADMVINYRTEDWVAMVQTAAEAGVNVVLDMVAGPYVEKNIGLLAPDGRYAMIAFLKGPKAEVNFAPVLTKRLMITGSTLRPQSVAQKAAIAARVEAMVWPLIATKQLQTKIFKVFPLAQAAEAHRLMESSAHMGKLVLEIPQ